MSCVHPTARYWREKVSTIDDVGLANDLRWLWSYENDISVGHPYGNIHHDYVGARAATLREARRRGFKAAVDGIVDRLGHLAMEDWTGPEWLECLGDLVDQYIGDVMDLEDAALIDESYRVEVTSPPSRYNDRDWRLYRRCVRQEMHRRGLKTPTEAEMPF